MLMDAVGSRIWIGVCSFGAGMIFPVTSRSRDVRDVGTWWKNFWFPSGNVPGFVPLTGLIPVAGTFHPGKSPLVEGLMPRLLDSGLGKRAPCSRENVTFVTNNTRREF